MKKQFVGTLAIPVHWQQFGKARPRSDNYLVACFGSRRQTAINPNPAMPEYSPGSPSAPLPSGSTPSSIREAAADAAGPSAWTRAVEKLRDRQRELVKEARLPSKPAARPEFNESGTGLGITVAEPIEKVGAEPFIDAQTLGNAPSKAKIESTINAGADRAFDALWEGLAPEQLPPSLGKHGLSAKLGVLPKSMSLVVIAATTNSPTPRRDTAVTSRPTQSGEVSQDANPALAPTLECSDGEEPNVGETVGLTAAESLVPLQTLWTPGENKASGGRETMRCMACGAQMILMSVVEDERMEVAGFAWHTFTCSECKDVERRLVFQKSQPEVNELPPSQTLVLASAIEEDVGGPAPTSSAEIPPNTLREIRLSSDRDRVAALGARGTQPVSANLLRRMLNRIWRR